MIVSETSPSQLLFALLMNWSMLPPFNHTWQICAMESELFKKHPSIQLARPPPPTLTKNGRKYVFNNVEGLKGNYSSSSMVRSALEHIPEHLNLWLPVKWSCH